MESSDVIKQKPKVVNVGIIAFAEALKNQGANVVHVDWKPPAEGSKKIIDLLDKLL